MHIAQAIDGLQVLTTEQVDQVSGAATFGYWVGKLSVWSSPAGIVADAISGGRISESAGQAMSRAEDWVNG